MSRRLRALLCATLAVPLLACSGALDPSVLLQSGTEEPVIVPGTPSEPSPRAPAAVPCGDPCGMLLEQDLEELRAGAYCTQCGEVDPTACRGTWLGDLTCTQYDWLRNCIYARLGYDFSGSDWRKVFDDEDWYTPDPSFRWDQVSPVQVQNAKTLQRIVDSGECAS